MPAKPAKERFRQGVVAVIINSDGLILMGERSDHPGNWQFPQGGIEGNETPEEALYREVKEELGNGKVKILKVSEGQSTYRWPEPGKKYAGQDHTWFLIRFKKGEGPNLKKSDGCFRAYKWEDPDLVVAQIFEWKQAAYAQGLKLLGFPLVTGPEKS